MSGDSDQRPSSDYVLGEIRSTVNNTAEDVRSIKTELGSISTRVSATETRLTSIETQRALMIPQYQQFERKVDHHINTDQQWKTAFDARKKGLVFSGKLVWSVITLAIGSSGLAALWEAFK